MRDGILNLLPSRIAELVQGKTSGTEPTEFDKIIAEGIKWNKKMVPSYHENVVDQFTSAFGARYIERYEDLFVDSILDERVKQKNESAIFLEMGVGTGRYLIRYGARMLNAQHRRGKRTFYRRKSKVCQGYREDPVLNKYYSYDDNYDKNLKLLIGVDFQEGMINKSVKVLKAMRLTPLVGKRILLFIAASQYFDLAFDRSSEYRDCFKVVTCLFQTLGNQPREHQIELLKNMKNLAAPHGKVIVSVFNKEKFVDFGLNRFYIYEVAPTVGEMRDDPEAIKLRKEGILVTKRGVYSKWFDRHELIDLFDSAGLHATIVNSGKRAIFPNDTEYINKKTQEQIGELLILAEANV